MNHVENIVWIVISAQTVKLLVFLFYISCYFHVKSRPFVLTHRKMTKNLTITGQGRKKESPSSWTSCLDAVLGEIQRINDLPPPVVAALKRMPGFWNWIIVVFPSAATAGA